MRRLSKKEIAAIENLLDRAQNGETGDSIAASLGFNGKARQQNIHTTFQVLRRCGVSIVDLRKNNRGTIIRKDEYEDFKRWQALKKANAKGMGAVIQSYLQN